ncbi:unnamed protein product [Staurois parvus]|uniref:Uncharacterized protein n=1 Tax=Staurois parvus TaxID=386267 RepID=A0ABN9B115_9NEOB|nr:unnamed protein product [Staurois parvus]
MRCAARRSAVCCVPRTQWITDHRKSRRYRLSHVISCVQSQLITSPAVPPVTVHQCLVSVLISASCQCPSVPHQYHISVPTSAHQCHISVPI